MWTNNLQLNLSDDRHKEYQRQQERLKAMANISDKARSVSTDLMIESLFKDSFRKPSTSGYTENAFTTDLPPWLQCESPSVPAHYKYLWSVVKTTFDMADTQKVSQLLLTSGLHVDVLGYIWNLANKSVPGQLTKQEFYIVLALVGLAQTGCTFNSLNVVKLLPAPSVPVLQPDVIKIQSSQTVYLNKTDKVNLNTVPKVQSFDSLKEIENENNQFFINSGMSKSVLQNDNDCNSRKNKIDSPSGYISKANVIKQVKNIKFPSIGSSPTADLEDDFSEFQSVSADNCNACVKPNFCDLTDDFTDFQSANVEQIDPLKTMVISQKKDIPKIPLPKTFSGKLTNLKTSILKISPETERKLKKLSPSESLSSLPESKISSSNKVFTNVSILGNNHGIGSRLANHTLSAKLDKAKHHKYHKIKTPSSLSAHPNPEEDIILGFKTSNIEVVIPKCCPKKQNSNNFILKETVIRNENEDQKVTRFNFNHSGENTRQIEIPMLGTINETTLPSQAKLLPTVDLISVQEDKYSALREAKLEFDQGKTQIILDTGESNEEFGDFLSANILLPSSSDQDLSIQNSAADPVSSLSVDKKKESSRVSNFIAKPDSHATSHLEDGNLLESFKPTHLKTDEGFFDSFNLLTLNGKENSNSLSISSKCNVSFEKELNSTLLNTLNKISFKADNLDKITEPECKQIEKGNLFSNEKSITLANNQPNNEFWDFLSSHPKPFSEDSSSNHGSLPSLDLKVSVNEELDQEVVWKKCFDSCLFLLEEGFEIFNSITVKSVMNEVFTSPKTSDYLNGLYIVHQISKRLIQNCSELASSQKELEKLWQRLQELCFEYNVQLINDEVNNFISSETCAICLGCIGNYIVTQGTNNYHTSCANLWINFVDEILPYST